MVTGYAGTAVKPRRAKGIDFAPLVDQSGNQRTNVYFAGSQHDFEEMARRTRWAVAPRMFLLALARMDRTGHAMFAPGELYESLAKLDRDTGELFDGDRTAIAKALRSLIDDELICADSTTQCIRLSAATAQKDYGKNLICRVHH